MTLTLGTRLGPYEISAAIGAGGMGEVFRARDTHLNRDVAVKVLPAALSGDVERLARFKREAQVLASLNHPNIAQIFGFDGATVGDGSTAHFLAMELVEGEDLAQRLKRGPVPIDETMAIAKQIAEGLEEAHERGIIHRDLKPANIKATPDGKVKILDFGLAKALEGDPSSSSSSQLSHSPTMSRHMTEAGMIMGTAAYMSPEQARGKPVDKRADIWSFGVVLFEMLTGERLFKGETVSDTLAAVLREEVPWPSLPPSTPPALRTLLKRCLARDPRERLRDIGEARFFLGSTDHALAASASGPAIAPARRPSGTRSWTALAALALAVAGVVAIVRFGAGPGGHPGVARLEIPLPPGQVATGYGGPAITRDGRMIAYAARDVDGIARLYLRALDKFESTVVPESDGAGQPFFSPKGDRVAFFARGKLMTASVSGGAPTAIADASYQTFGGTWGEDDKIVYVPTLQAGLLRVSAAGGKTEKLTEPDAQGRGYAHAFPQYLPDGDLLFTIWGGTNSELAGTYVLPRGSTSWTPAAPGDWRALYVTSGHLVQSGPRNLTAIPFTPGRPAASVAPTLVIEGVFTTPNLNVSWFAVSDTGTLVYVPGDPIMGTLAWVERDGTITRIEDKPSRIGDAVLSPDGTTVAFVLDDSVWTLELRRGIRTRLTFDREGTNRFATWSHDGARIFFSSNRTGDWDLYSIPANGGKATPILTRPGIQLCLAAAPDGTVLFAQREQGNGTDLYLLSPKGEVTPFVVSPFSTVGGQFSPDGRLVAYVSDEAGGDEVYVRSVAHPDQTTRISTEGGRAPKWSPDGRELYFRRGDVFFAVPIATAGRLTAGDAKRLFEVPAAVGTATQQSGVSVAPDGRFLVQLQDRRAIPTTIHVVLNWFEELKAKVPPR